MAESQVPESIAAYTAHGVELKIGDDEATGECPFCGRENKFNVNIQSSKYQCWTCGATGNSVSFLRALWELAKDATTKQDYEDLCEKSGWMDPDSPRLFGVVKNPLNDKWSVPGYNVESKMTGLYKFGRIKKEKSDGSYTWVDKLLPTKGMGHHLFNIQNYDPNKKIIDLCEGWRDGIAWFECVRLGSVDGVKLLDKRNVISVAGTNSFKPQWAKFFSGCVVNILFDNDHPGLNEKTGQATEPAGVVGVKRVASMLSSYTSPPSEINYIAWGGESQGFTKSLKAGMDLRDFLRS